MPFAIWYLRKTVVGWMSSINRENGRHTQTDERTDKREKIYRLGIGAQSLVELLDGNLVVVDVQFLLQLVHVFTLFGSFLARSRILSPILHRRIETKEIKGLERTHFHFPKSLRPT